MMALLAALAGASAAWCAATIDRSSTRRIQLRPARRSSSALVVAGLVAAVGAALLLAVPVVVLVCSALAVVVGRVLAQRERQRRHRVAMDADAVIFCFAVAGELRIGRMPGEAVASTVAQLGPLAEGMVSLARAASHGGSVASELQALAAHVSSRRLETVAALWTAAATTGARVAEVLERVANAFAAEDEAVADLEALAAGPRATALVLCVLPIVGIALATAIGSHPLRLLLHSTLGGLLLGGAVILDGCGLLWVRAVATRALHG